MSEVRSTFMAARVPGQSAPYDTLHLRALYPARPIGVSSRQREHGLCLADEQGAPYPVVIFLNGMLCDPVRYHWLLLSLVRRGMVCVTLHWVAEPVQGLVALTPGLDLARVTPKGWGLAPAGVALRPALQALAEAHAGDGPLRGALDLSRVVLGGHSAGGAAALYSAHPRYFPEVLGVFSYGAHSLPDASLGFEPGRVLELCDELPVLLMGGSQDGLLGRSAARDGQALEPLDVLQRTFHRLGGTRGDRYLVWWRGANHFSVVHPLDETHGLVSLDREVRGDPAELRACIAQFVGDFIEGPVLGREPALKALPQQLHSSLVQYHSVL